MVYSVTGAQVYNQIKKDYVKPNEELTDDYKKWANTSGALNINRYYLVLIARSLELYLCKRLYGDMNSLETINSQIEYLSAAIDSMSAKISSEDIELFDTKLTELNNLICESIIMNSEGHPAYMNTQKKAQLKTDTGKLYRLVLLTLEKYDMLTFKEENPQDVLSDFGE